MGVKPWDGLRIIRQPKGASSHCVFKRGQRLLTFPHPRVRIGEHYTKEAGAYLKEMTEVLEDIRDNPTSQ